MSDKPLIGVLALQGAFREHRLMVEGLGFPTREVRLPTHLDGLSGMIMPGGESTAIGKLLVEWDLLEPIGHLARAGMPLWGTCAGAILMARCITERGRVMDQPRMNLLDITVERNAFGRQVDSFETDLLITLPGCEGPFPGVFIRAPVFSEVGDGVCVRCRHEGRAVFVTRDHLWASAFHPELSDDSRLHLAFCRMASECAEK